MYEENYSISLLRLEEALYLVEEILSSNASQINLKNKQLPYFKDILGEQFSTAFNETGSIIIASLLSLKNLSESLYQDIPHPELHQLSEILQHLAKIGRTSIDFQSARPVTSGNNIVQLARLIPNSTPSLHELIISAVQYGRELVVHIYEDFQRANAPTHN